MPNQKDSPNNCEVLGTSDASHVKVQTPFQLKKRELIGENLAASGWPENKAPNPDDGIDVARQTQTRKYRYAQPGKGESVKPI